MEDFIMLEECPLCRGAGMIVHEGGWNVRRGPPSSPGSGSCMNLRPTALETGWAIS